MLGLALNDVITSVSALLLPFATPNSTGLPFAIGNNLSCQLAPLFVLQGFGSFYYCGGLLGFYFLLVIRFGWSEQATKRWLEPWVHIFPWLLGWGTSILLVVYKRYTVDPLLGLCTNDSCAHDRNGKCLVPWPLESKVYVTQPFYFGAFAMAIIGIVCTWWVYWTVRSQEKSMQKYNQNNVLKQRKSVARQAVCYSLACLNGIVVSILVELRFHIVGDVATLQDRPEVVLYLIPILVLFPLQGLFNWIIYCRPLYARLRGMHPNESRLAIYKRILTDRRRPPRQRLPGKLVQPKPTSSTLHPTCSLHGSSNLYLQNVRMEEKENHDQNGIISVSLEHNNTIPEETTAALDSPSQIVTV